MNMTRYAVLFTLATIAVLVGSVVYFASRSPDGFVPGQGGSAIISPVTGELTDDTTVRLLPVQKDYNQYGTAYLEQENGRVRVTLNMDRIDGLNQPQPAHIHVGGCPGVSSVAYPLSNVIDGRSETYLDTTIDSLKLQVPLTINVHKSSAEIDQYTSCGDLSF